MVIGYPEHPSRPRPNQASNIQLSEKTCSNFLPWEGVWHRVLASGPTGLFFRLVPVGTLVGFCSSDFTLTTMFKGNTTKTDNTS